MPISVTRIPVGQPVKNVFGDVWGHVGSYWMSRHSLRDVTPPASRLLFETEKMQKTPGVPRSRRWAVRKTAERWTSGRTI